MLARSLITFILTIICAMGGAVFPLPALTQALTASEIEPGVSFYETSQPTAVNSQTTLWVYLPTGTKGKLPCVVIAPAGTPLIWGMNLGDGDRSIFPMSTLDSQSWPIRLMGRCQNALLIGSYWRASVPSAMRMQE